MSIKLIVARTAKELDDVFKLRHEVYVVDKGRFSLDSSSNENKSRLVDRFDTFPGVANIIAYDDDMPVACMRVNKDSEMGLPAEVHLDFSSSRQRIARECEEKQINQVIMSAGMLAIRKKWRNRRNIIYALFKTAANIGHAAGASHVIATISEETRSLYGRIGFEAVGKSEWCESIGDKLIPMLAPFDKAFSWSFDDIYSPCNSIWINCMGEHCERVLLSKGEALFYQDDIVDNAYVIDEGWISISRTDDKGNEMVLSNISKGELFGELAIFDQSNRSATATALTNVELIVIPREDLLKMIKENPEQVGQLLSYFAKRLRDMGDRAMIQVFAPQSARIQFELQKLWYSAVPDHKRTDVRNTKVGPKQIASSAHVHVDDVMMSLEHEKKEGNLEYGEQFIRFLKKPIITNNSPK